MIVSLYLKGGGENLYITGQDKEHEDILVFSDVMEKWTVVGKMSQPRNTGAVSIVEMEEFKYYCQ